jgi:hypothetical protein
MATPLIYGITREQISFFLGQKERKYHVDNV